MIVVSISSVSDDTFWYRNCFKVIWKSDDSTNYLVLQRILFKQIILAFSNILKTPCTEIRSTNFSFPNNFYPQQFSTTCQTFSSSKRSTYRSLVPPGWSYSDPSEDNSNRDSFLVDSATSSPLHSPGEQSVITSNPCHQSSTLRYSSTSRRFLLQGLPNIRRRTSRSPLLGISGPQDWAYQGS